MTPEDRARLVEEATNAWRPLDRDGLVRAHPAWHDLDEQGRRELFGAAVRARWLEAALDPQHLSATARAVLTRLEEAG